MPVVDGQSVDFEDRDGTLGTTGGNVPFATGYESNPSAQPLRVTDHGLVVDSSPVNDLLTLINQQLRRIAEVLS